MNVHLPWILLTLSHTSTHTINRVIAILLLLSWRSVLDGLFRIQIWSDGRTEETGRGFEEITVTIKGGFRRSKRTSTPRSGYRERWIETELEEIFFLFPIEAIFHPLPDGSLTHDWDILVPWRLLERYYFVSQLKALEVFLLAAYILVEIKCLETCGENVTRVLVYLRNLQIR